MGIVYQIYCEDDSIEDTYVGSTVDIEDRKRCHKRDNYDVFNKKFDNKLYDFIFFYYHIRYCFGD